MAGGVAAKRAKKTKMERETGGSGTDRQTGRVGKRGQRKRRMSEYVTGS